MNKTYRIGIFVIFSMLFSSIVLAQNSAPTLTNWGVTPQEGNTSTIFTYYVVYTDADNDPPFSVTLTIDGTSDFNMSPAAGGDSDFTNGELYEFTATLSEGSHTYVINASDGTDSAQPVGGDGPTVTAPNSPPQAEAGSDQTVNVGDVVQFDGSASSDSDGVIVSYDWDFGDGSQASGVSTTHTFSSEGDFTVTLTVTDDDGATGVDTLTVHVLSEQNFPPQAEAGSDQTVNVGDVVQFDGSHSSDSDGVIVSYEWDFGDGSQASGVSTTHTFSSEGDFTVTLTVTDDDGATGEDTLVVHVSLPNSPPVVGQTSAIPAYVPNTGLSTSKLTAQVTDVDDNLLSVYIDLTPIGKDASTPMRDDGVYPDDVASDGIFTVVTSVAPGTEVGQKSLSVTATDTMGAQGVGTILLNVVEDPPDNPPTLTSESVTPTSGTTTTNFRYEVTYTDQDNNPPSYVDVSIDGGTFVAMTEMDTTDYNYMDGKQYYYDTTGLSVGDHSYNIRTSDGTNPVSIGANGPSVSGTNTPPELSNASVTPTTGTTSTNFRYEVTYTDADNDDPVQMDLIIVDSASTCTGGSPCIMTKVDPSDADYTDGVIYYYEYTDPWGSTGTKSYTINTSDGIDTDSLGGTGPEITSSTNTPPELSNASVTPTTGTTSTNFRYEVTYTDADNDDPTLGANGVQIVIEAVTYDMVPDDPSDTDYTDGAIFYYEYTATWGSTGTKSYTINTSDGTDTDSLGGTGPEITSDPNTAPQLSSYAVIPSCGNTSTVFIYEVTFTDADNDNPDYGGSVTGVQIDIDGGGFVDMSEMDTSDTTYSDGKEYYYVYSTGLGIGGHSYTIRTGDGTDTTSVAGTGPEIPTGDCAPPTPPSIAIAPTSGYVGTTVTVTGIGFYSNERHITVTFSGSKVNLTPIGGTSPDDNGTVKADASGSFSATFAVPSSSAGSKSVDAYGDSTSASSVPNRTFTVILPYPYYPPTPPPYIPPGGGSGGGSPSDKVAPETQITQPKNGEIISGTFYVIKGTASDDQSEVKKVEVSTDGGLTWNLTTGTTSWSYRWTLPTDGIYIIKAKATDNKGNEEESMARVTVTIDNSSPIVEILNLENNTLLSGVSHQMNGTAMDNGEVSKVEVSTDGGVTWQPADGTESWSFLWNLGADSFYVVKVRARDKAGNVEITEGITVIVDNTPPKSSINLLEGQEITEESIVITGMATDANGVKLVEISTDGGVTWLPARGTTSWSYEWRPPEDGNYTIVVRVTDMALNQAIGQSVSVIVVTELPGGFRVNWKIFAMIGAGVILGLGLVLLYLYYRR